MDMTITVTTKRGFYNSSTTQDRTLEEILDKVIPELEKMPEEIDGEKLVDWTTIYIEIKR